MTVDFWRALGVGAASAFGWQVASLFVYGSALSITTADYVMLPISFLLLGVFSCLYFYRSSVVPSVKSGFMLALIMLVYNFLSGVVSGIIAIMQGVPEPVLPPPSAAVFVLALVIGLGTPTLVGWYMGKK